MNAANTLILFLLILVFMLCQPLSKPAPIIEDAPPAPEASSPRT